MAKSTKSTRSRRPSVGDANPRSYSDLLKREQQKAAVAVAPAPVVNKAAPSREERREEKIDWNAEYGQVFADLRQLIVISVVLFVVMIVLGFVI